MRFRKAPKRIVELSPAEVRLLRYALMQFRNKVLCAGKPTEDIDEISISALSLNLQDVSTVLVGSEPVASGLMEASNRHLV